MSPRFGSRPDGPDGLAAVNAEIDRLGAMPEHAALIRLSWRSGLENYTGTRRGRTAVERGTVTDYLANPGRSLRG